MKEVFEIVECPYALRNELKLKSRKIPSVRYDIETASFVGARVFHFFFFFHLSLFILIKKKTLQGLQAL